MSPPAAPKIYHIVHVDRLASIVADGALWSDAEVQQRAPPGTIIGMSEIKRRRMAKSLYSHPDICVGDCVPFYFCPRSVMLYVIAMSNHSGLDYRGGQGPIVHLEADVNESVAWAERHSRRWAFTSTNAAASYAEDYCDLQQLGQIDWNAVEAKNWRRCRGRKQAEFLMEHSFPWTLVRRVGVRSVGIRDQVAEAMRSTDHRPDVELRREWYY